MKTLLMKLAQLKLKAVSTPWVHLVHIGIGFAVVMLAHLWMPKAVASAGMLLVAGVIEFWYDKHYENQSFEQNAHDFEDYLIGVLLAWLI